MLGDQVFKMKYGEAIKKSMDLLALEPNTLFLGYNINFGSQGYGTLKDVPFEKKIETPVAENLMIGLAMGLSLEGFKPVVFFERHDFMLNASDGLVNHLDKIEQLSHGEFKMPVIVRAVVGAEKPLNPGLQHTQNFTNIFKEILNFPVYSPRNASEVLRDYEKAMMETGPVMIVEKRDLYENE